MNLKAFFVFLMVFGLIAASDITECVEISSSGTYTLSANLNANESPCIIVSADDVVLDCNGKKITANSSSAVLILVDADNFKMQECKMEKGRANITGKGITIYGIDSSSVQFFISNSEDVNITNSYFSAGDSQVKIIGSNSIFVKKTRFSKGKVGLSIDESSSDILVEECEFKECSTSGAEILGEATIRNNIFEKNKKGLVVKDECSIHRNRFVENTDYALVINGEENVIYDNKFEGNNKDADVGYTDNDFNIKKNCNQTNIIGGKCQGGNYWDKYTGYDSDGDGFGETPHEVARGVYDNLPLTSFFDQREPTVYLDAPVDGQVLNTRNVIVKYRAFDDVAVAQCWAILDGVQNQISGCIKQYELKNVADGEHTLTLRVVDYAGKKDEKTIRFKVDATAPLLEIKSPEEGKEYTGEVQVYFVASDTTPIQCFYRIDSEEEKEILGCKDFKLTNLTTGQHKITIRVMDAAGNNETEYKNFKFLAKFPEMTVEYSMKCPQNELEVDVYANGQKLNGVMVELKRRIQPGQFSSIGKRMYDGMTISFRILESGEYVLSANKEGYEEYEELVNLRRCAVESGGPTEYIAPPVEEEKPKSCLGMVLFSVLGIGIMLRREIG
ncbi:MAG: NosD domain-containing protein [Candidatus Anstonellales archaeon]